ncbi:MAG: hypothetical protein ACYC6B_09255 [Thermoleophilia bacterium]
MVEGKPFPTEFRAKAVRLCRMSGQTMAATARNLKVSNIAARMGPTDTHSRKKIPDGLNTIYLIMIYTHIYDMISQ